MNCPKCAGLMKLEPVQDFFRPFWMLQCLSCGLRTDEQVLANRKACQEKGVEMPKFKSEEDKKAWVEKCRRTRALKHKEQEPLEIPEPEPEPEITFNRFVLDKDKVKADLDRLKEASWPTKAGDMLRGISQENAALSIDQAIQRAFDEVGILQKAKEIMSRQAIPEVTSV